MFLLPLLILGLAAVGLYRLAHRQSQPAMESSGGSAVLRAPHSFWPDTVPGKAGVAAFAVSLLPSILVNVVQVPFLGLLVQPVALVLTGIARFKQHDGSTSVLIAFVLSGLAVTFTVLFLGGEILIGHD